MDVTPESLAEKFRLYNDDELLELFRSGELTEMAQTIARAELASRGIDPGRATAPPSRSPDQEPEPEPDSEPVIQGDLVMVARMLNPIEAEMLRGRLEAEGVPAMVADTLAYQTNVLKLALGGVRVMVPEAYLAQAREIVRADARGDYALDDGTDVGPPADNP
ncbi:MAG: DUF2007 domain-containing protein [Xanthobacteraceae bacterium]|nr:DUF2007 domain-containing protein [Xanthobacteraceae bacterium]